MFNAKLRDLNAHLLDQKMLYETTQNIIILNSLFVSQFGCLNCCVIYGDRCFNFGQFSLLVAMTNLGKYRFVFVDKPMIPLVDSK